MQKLTLIKLGGSLITDKEIPFKARLRIIRRLSEEIHKAREKTSDKLIIGNGGGSFVHPIAKKYNLIKGLNSENLIGLAELQEATVRLNQIIVQNLVKVGDPAFSFDPSSFLIAEDGKVKRSFIEPIVKLLGLNMLPVVYGSAVLDLKKGVAGFSTERIFSLLVSRLNSFYNINKIIFCGKTDGVYDDRGKTIPLITKANYSKVKRIIGSTEGIDVTGGMTHKIEEAIEFSKRGITIFIINGNRKGELTKAILDKTHRGSEVKYER